MCVQSSVVCRVKRVELNWLLAHGSKWLAQTLQKQIPLKNAVQCVQELANVSIHIAQYHSCSKYMSAHHKIITKRHGFCDQFSQAGSRPVMRSVLVSSAGRVYMCGVRAAPGTIDRAPNYDSECTCGGFELHLVLFMLPTIRILYYRYCNTFVYVSLYIINTSIIYKQIKYTVPLWKELQKTNNYHFI